MNDKPVASKRDRESSPFGPRLHLARRKSGLSLRALAEATGGAASHETIRQMERGLKIPDDATMDALCEALGVTRDSLMAHLEISLGEVEFRKKAGTSSADRVAIRHELLELLERYLEIEDILELDVAWRPPCLEVGTPNDSEDYPEEMASALRRAWELGVEPIHDFTRLLEEKGLKILCPEASIDISGLTCEVHRVDRPSVFAIVVNRQHSLERRRFTLAHELAHRVLDLKGLTGKMAESFCNRFAGAFLVPKEALERVMGSKQRIPAYREIMIAKKFFRVSAAMFVLRLKQVGLMDTAQRDWFFQKIGSGWRTTEPEPLEDWLSSQLEPPRFESLVYQALTLDFISEGKAAELLQVPIREVRRGIIGS
jgi:Zn-dependent peptidase ImmA (M78 family)